MKENGANGRVDIVQWDEGMIHFLPSRHSAEWKVLPTVVNGVPICSWLYYYSSPPSHPASAPTWGKAW